MVAGLGLQGFAHKKGDRSLFGIITIFFRKKISSDREDVILHPSKYLLEIYFFYECIEQIKN